jgi:raffinose/stachyose/melibiose transport system substrate-binding protein
MILRKSKLVVVLLAVLVVSLLPFNSVFAAKKVTIRVLNYLDASSPGASREIIEVWQKFEADNPDILVIREDQFNEPFHHKTEAYAAAGKLPEVLYVWPGGRSSTLHEKKLLKDITPFLGDKRNDFIDAALVPQAGGYLAMVPIGLTASHAMYVNTALLEELNLKMPKTYQDLKEMVAPLKAVGKDVIVMGAQDDWVMQSVLYSMIFGRIAGNEKVEQFIAGKAKFTDKVFVDTLKFYEQLFTDGVLSRKVMQTPYGEAPALFAAGKAPFMIDGDWRASAFLTDPTTDQALIAPKDQKKVTITVFPAIPGEVNSRASSIVPAVGYAMSAHVKKGSAEEKAAWRLIEWLNSMEVQKLRLETGAAFPTRKGVTSDRLEPLAQERAEFYGRISGTYVLDDKIAPEVCIPLNVGLQEIGMGLATPEQVAQKVQAAYDGWAKAKK